MGERMRPRLSAFLEKKPNGSRWLSHQLQQTQLMDKLFRINLFVLLLATTAAAQPDVPVPIGVVGMRPFFHPLSVLDAMVVKFEEFELREPGTYSATSWDISGVMRLPMPGDYFVVAR